MQFGKRSRIDIRLWQTVDSPAASDDQRANAFEELRRRADLNGIMMWVVVSTLLAAASLLGAQFFLEAHHSGSTRWSIFGRALVAGLWSVGAWACAVVIGFLFGVPRSRTTDHAVATTSASKTDSNVLADRSARREPGLSVNTNLEQISDWLTKILVGVGLTQLVKVPTALTSAAAFMCKGDCAISCEPLAAAVVVVFSPLGFMLGYLATRLYLSSAFDRADKSLSGSGNMLTAQIGPSPDGGGSAITSDLTELAFSNFSMAAPRDLPPEYAAVDFHALYADAKKELYAKAFGPAILHYRQLLQLKPDDPTLLRECLWALFKGSSHWSPEIAAMLLRLESVRDDGDRNLRSYIYASLTFHYLYNEKQAGYDKTIALATEYTEQNKGRPAAGILINLACAFGQKYKNAPQDEQAALRDKALKAVNDAINVDPSSKTRLASLLGGIDGDDDLSAFAKDEEFRKAVGLV